jgi:hypothetical protein
MAQKRVSENPFDPQSDHQRRVKKTPQRKPRRWPWLFLLLLVAGIFFLPNIIAKTSLKQAAIDYALADFNGKISVQDMSLGWLSPIRISGVSAADTQGKPLITIDKMVTSKPLYTFLFDNDYGEVLIERPTVDLQLRPDGSNLEDALEKLMAPSDPPVESFKLPVMTIRCTAGIANVHSTATNEQWTIDSLNAVARTSTDHIPLSVEAQWQFTSAGAPVGGFAMNCQFDSGQDELKFGSGQVAINTQEVPVALAAPIMQRFVGPTSMTGKMTGEFQLAFDAATSQFAMHTQQLSLTGAGLSAPNLMGTDRIIAEHLFVQGQLDLSPQQISAAQFVVNSELAELSADGTFDAKQLTNLVSGGELLETPFHMEGRLDLAAIATMLPGTLQLHHDLKIQSGVVSFQATSKQGTEGTGQGSRRMVVNVDTANIRARRGNQDIVWQKPLRLAGIVHQHQGQLSVEDVRVEADFLQLQGSGSLEAGQFVARGDLAQLVQRVGQFADLGGAEFAGNLDGEFGWQIANDPAANDQSFSLLNRPIRISGRFDIADPGIKWPTLPVWQPGQLSIQIQGTGTSQSENRMRLDNGGFQLLVGTEKLTASLAQPVANLWDITSWKFATHLTGEFAGWLGHAKNFVDLGPIEGSGNIDLTCVATIDSERAHFHQIEYAVDRFGFDGYGLAIREPRLAGKGNLNYNLASGQISLRQFTAQGQSIAANSEQLSFTFDPNLQLHGDITYQGNVESIAKWYGLSTRPDDIRWFGTLQGTAQLASDKNGIGGRIDAKIADLVAAQPVVANRQSAASLQLAGNELRFREIWRESLVNLNSTLAFSNDFDSIRLQNLNVDAASVKLNAKGNIAQLSSSMVTDLSGSWNPNWQMVNALLGAYTGQMVRFTGNGAQAFTVKGPLFPPPSSQQPGWVDRQLEINTSVAWASAEIFSVPLGPNKVLVDLNQGVANLNAQAIPVMGGMLNLAPRLDLRGESPLLLIDQGLVADRIQLTPESCRQWLKYVAPLVADATSAKGTFTVTSRGIQMPVMDPLSVNAQGSILLTNASIGAGPLADQLLGTANQLRSLLKPGDVQQTRDYSSLLTIAEQEIPFAVQNQRVYHEGLTINYKDMQIRTRGSVGLDQSLDLVAEIPLRDEWLGGSRWLQGLKGQSLSIPVSGTVSAPRLDQRAVQQFSQQLVREAAGNALNNAVQEKIGGPPQEVLNNRLNEEVGKVQNKINNALQKEGEKLDNNVLNGLNNLFKKKGGDQ